MELVSTLFTYKLDVILSHRVVTVFKPRVAGMAGHTTNTKKEEKGEGGVAATAFNPGGPPNENYKNANVIIMVIAT